MTHRTRFVVVGFALPALLAVAALGIGVASGPLVPDPIATHWNAAGTVDGYGPLWATALLPLVIVLGYSVLVAAVLRSARERVTAIHKLLLVTAPFLATMVSVISAGSVLMQRGLERASDAPSIVPVVLTALAAAAALATVSWFVLPKASAPEPLASEQLPALDLTATARASWLQHAGPNPAIAVTVIVLLTLAAVVGTVALWLAAPLPALLVYLALILVVLFLGVGTLFWRVSIDRRGFRAVSVLGWPKLAYPLGEVESASAVTVDPIGDFGGWGLRWAGAGRLGVVLRRGEAIAVRRTNGKSTVVTVPAARTGAALLDALVSSRNTSVDRVE